MKLFLVRPEDIGENEKYFLITGTYCLLYTDNKPPKSHREIKDLKLLPALAMEWLNQTIDQMRTEYLRDNAQEILKRGKAFTERFEEELKAEKEKLEQEQTNGEISQ